MRSWEEVKPLFEAYAATGDIESRNEIMIAYQPLVKSIAREFQSGREPIRDLVSIANIGLARCIDLFDVSRDNAFSSYATPTLRGHLKNWFRDHGSLLKLPRKDLRLMRIILKAESVQSTLVNRLDLEALGKAIGVPCHELTDAYNLIYSAYPISGDSFKPEVQDGDAKSWWDIIEDSEREYNFTIDRMTLHTYLSRLPKRERVIIHLRYWDEWSQRKIAAHMGVSQMHVSRLIRQSLKRLREWMLTDDSEMSTFAA